MLAPLESSDYTSPALRDAFAPWVAAARKVGAAKRVIDLRTRGSRRAEDTAAIRAWAVENGIPVSARGRISSDLRARYAAEQ